MTLASQAFRPGGSTGKADALKYDAWNRLVEYKDDDSGAVLQKNEYDGLGRRIVRVDAQANPDVTYDDYYNDQWQLLTETKNSAVEAIYQWHPFYIDALAVRMRSSDTHFFLHDANFNVTAAVDDSTNAVVERYSYSPYGQVAVLDADFAPDADNKSDIGSNHLYTGRERDPETGLQLNRHRYFAWHLGRWVNRDPIRYRGGMNLYGYTASRPATFTDPMGLEYISLPIIDDDREWWEPLPPGLRPLPPLPTTGPPGTFTIRPKQVRRRGGRREHNGIEVRYHSNGDCHVKLVQVITGYNPYWSLFADNPAEENWSRPHFDCIDRDLLPPGTVYPGYVECGGQGGREGGDYYINDRPGWGGASYQKRFHATVCVICEECGKTKNLGCIDYYSDSSTDEFETVGGGTGVLPYPGPGGSINVQPRPPGPNWDYAEEHEIGFTL